MSVVEEDIFADVIDAEAARRRRGRGARRVWASGQERRQPVRSATATGLGPDLWELELHPVRALDDLAPEIERVTREAAEPNIFFTLPLLRAAYPRLARMRARSVGPVHLLCLYLTRPDEAGEDRRRLVLFTPLALPRLGWPGRVTAMAASNEYVPLGTPLVAADVLGEAVERCLMLLADPEMTLPPTLALPDARLAGPVARAFETAAAALGLPARTVQGRMRATHRTGEPTALSRKRERDYARQLRRLGERGEVRFETARKTGAVLDAFEAFMVLELESWKGERGSALYNRRQIAAFSRQSVADLAVAGACAIHSLKLDGATIASLIVLGDAETGLYTWKTAYDPDHRATSPGVQVLLAATRAMDEQPGLAVDSLAVEDHPVMDRVWRGRMEMGTRIIGLTTRAGGDVEGLSRAIDRRERWRAWAKGLVSNLRF